jgi:TonB family protein
VDALVEVDAEGEVKDIEIVRWAGYGLNEAVTATVRQLHFRPAMRDGRAVPVRVLLRYNFRRPAEENKAKGER